MAKIYYSRNESSYQMINNVGVFILIVGIVVLLILGLVGFSVMATDYESGITLIFFGVGFFVITYFFFGVLKGISELVFRAYLRFKLDHHNMAEADIHYEKR